MPAFFYPAHLPTSKERILLLARMMPHSRLATRRALARRYLSSVMSSSNDSEGRASRLASLPVDHAASALGALVAADKELDESSRRSKWEQGIEFVGYSCGAHCAGDLLVHLEDPKVRTAIFRRLTTATAGDILATMAPIDAAACLGRLVYSEPQAAVLAAMELHEADEIIKVRLLCY